MRLAIYVIGLLLGLTLVGAALQSPDYVGLLVASAVVFYATHVTASGYQGSLPTTNREISVSKAKPNIILARNIVAIALVCLFQPRELVAMSGSYELAVSISIGFIFIVSSVLTTLAWLFFTDSQTGRWKKNFSTFAWALTIVFIIVPWVVRLVNVS